MCETPFQTAYNLNIVCFYAFINLSIRGQNADPVKKVIETYLHSQTGFY